MALTRMLATSKVNLSHTFRADEALVDADGGGAVTGTVKRLDGTDVGAGNATTHTGLGTYARDVTRAPLDTLTLDWSGLFGGSTLTVRDIVEVCGDFLFGLAEVREEMGIDSRVSAARLARKRLEVEVECESICGVAWVPRFKRYVLDGSGDGDLVTPVMALRAVRSASVSSSGPAGPFVALTTDQLGGCAALDSGIIARTDDKWPEGRRNVIVEIEHGLDAPPEDVRSMAMLRLRSIIGRPKSTVPERAVSFTDPLGGVYRLTMPGAKATGIPDVDAAYARSPYRERVWIT